jgi:hypothetical protein
MSGLAMHKAVGIYNNTAAAERGPAGAEMISLDGSTLYLMMCRPTLIPSCPYQPVEFTLASKTVV